MHPWIRKEEPSFLKQIMPLTRLKGSNNDFIKNRYQISFIIPPGVYYLLAFLFYMLEVTPPFFNLIVNFYYLVTLIIYHRSGEYQDPSINFFWIY